MRALDLAQQNFAVAETLLQLHHMLEGLTLRGTPNNELRLAVCRAMEVGDHTSVKELGNSRLVLYAQDAVSIPDRIHSGDGIDFLLRQAVVVACTAVESFFWDILQENVLTIVRARGNGADESIRNLNFTLGDYISMEGYEDKDLRLKQLILRNFERATLSGADAIEKIASTLTVQKLYDKVADHTGISAKELRKQIGDLITRRNKIAHRADRPTEDEETDTEIDGHSLRKIRYAWVNTRVQTAKAVVDASSRIIGESLETLENNIRIREEQRLAQAASRRRETSN
jgi:hypothetical protein